MKKIVPIPILIILCVNYACSNDSVKQLANKSLCNDQRGEIVNSLKRLEPTLTISSDLLVIMRNNRSPIEPGFGDKPWMNDFLSLKAKIWYAAAAVWDAWFEGKNDIKKVEILLELLDKHNDSYSHYVILDTLRVDQWDEQAEGPVFELAQDNKKEIESRRLTYEVLIQRCKDKYISGALNFVKSLPKDKRLRCFQTTFNTGNDFFKYSLTTQQEIIKIGFNILEAESRDNLQVSYGVARQLGFFLKAPNEFTPDQNDPKYKNKHGLNKSFFIDTVINALSWKKKNLGAL